MSRQSDYERYVEREKRKYKQGYGEYYGIPTTSYYTNTTSTGSSNINWNVITTGSGVTTYGSSSVITCHACGYVRSCGGSVCPVCEEGSRYSTPAVLAEPTHKDWLRAEVEATCKVGREALKL